MHRFTRVARFTLVLLLPVAFGACEWFTDFKTQPHIEPWEAVSQNPNDTTTPPRGQPMYSVPIQGTVSPAFLYSYTPAPATLDSMAGIPNPHAADDRSLAEGRMQYQINCAVCHGNAGGGLTTSPLARVNPAYAWSPSLLTEAAVARSDGYIYAIIRNGRGAMPNYNRVEESERWDIVNYLRALQAGTADTTLVGYPGENGPTVPGASFTAPTRPAPYVHPGVQVTPGSPGINSATFKGYNDGLPKEKH
jgi:mono/diheme cytochrome c family protein